MTQAAALVRSMVLHPRDDSRLVDQLTREVSIMGDTMLSVLHDHGVGVVILRRGERRQNLELPPGRALSERFDNPRWGTYADGMLGVYYPQQGVVLVGEGRLVFGMRGHSTVMHEFGHALDFALTDHWRLPQMLSDKLWEKFAPTRRGWVTTYASSQPIEYFAESVMAFFHTGLRGKLRWADPGLFALLTELFE